ncbi:hypothetical protein [Actinoplanes utahensis]|uniref:Uncharacterized protein n=1 Tax=Actinoplanes utahensis TaxID=1869 RepID=A0A0A6UKT4_ACTUT|nr:hypothetical protein [Actinoplanes utahensis]KHD76061.1 hypothetical protein MB27_19485 [Actinoplanes utahensis]GIF34715.1 hypothetical protein Aut01nite_77010 [Actinoplanes utahensis]
MGLLRRIARARLAGRVIRLLRRAGIPGARYHSRAFEIRFTAPGDSEPTIVPLTPLIGRKDLGSFVAGLLRVPAAWTDAAPLLRPVLRGAAPGALLRRPALPFLSEFVVVDQPDTMTYVTPAQSVAWKTDADRIFARARANLTGAVLHGTATGPVTVRFVDDGNAYWTSHLLLPGWLTRLTGQVGGTPVAFAPERGTLLVTAEESPHLVALFAEAEAIFVTSPHPLSPMAYVSDPDGCTVPYTAPPGHRLHQTVRRAERLLAVREYDVQPADPEHPSAPLQLLGSTAEGWRTRALWPKDSPTLLPEADEVQVGDRTVAWPDLLPHLTPAGHTPPRWLATSWPP